MLDYLVIAGLKCVCQAAVHAYKIIYKVKGKNLIESGILRYYVIIDISIKQLY